MSIILATTSAYGKFEKSYLEEAEAKGFKFVLNPYKRKLKKNEFLELLQKHKPAALLAGLEIIDKDILSSPFCPKVISRVGTGVDNIDMVFAQEQGIKIFRTPGILAASVAELTVGLIIDMLRRISLHDRSIRNGFWEKNMGTLLSDKKVGIIGFGYVGKYLARILKAFNSNVGIFDPVIKTSDDYNVYNDINILLAESDIVTLHASAQFCLIGKREFDLIKKGAYLVNTSRGLLIDEDALYASLVSGKLAGAALDVFAHEPYSGKLVELDNVVLTTHIGSYSLEAKTIMERQSLKNAIDALG